MFGAKFVGTGAMEQLVLNEFNARLSSIESRLEAVQRNQEEVLKILRELTEKETPPAASHKEVK
jgi:hypothetical protein